MRFTNIRDLKYITEDNSFIDLYATCKEYGEIPMTLNLVDTENLHTHIDENGIETPLEVYCKTLKIAPFEPIKISNEQRIVSIKAKANELITSKYPDYKQLNIIRLGGEDLITMGNYIDSIRAISNKAEVDGTALEDINWSI